MREKNKVKKREGEKKRKKEREDVDKNLAAQKVSLQ